jgi:hypothetical protein
MRADVQEGPQLAVEIANENGSAKHVDREKVPGSSQVAGRRDGMPRGQEKVPQLGLILFLRVIAFGP